MIKISVQYVVLCALIIRMYSYHDQRILLLDDRGRKLDKGGSCDAELDSPGRLGNEEYGYEGEGEGYGNEGAA